MNKIFFTITGAQYYYGQKYLEKGMIVKLVKETDNKYDNEAVKVELDGLGKIGYVANSPYTVIGEKSFSAGRLYDKIGDVAEGSIIYVLPNGILCSLTDNGLNID